LYANSATVNRRYLTLGWNFSLFLQSKEVIRRDKKLPVAMKHIFAVLLAVVLLVILVNASSENNILEENENLNELHRDKRNVARFCKKIGGVTGWYCDDPASRWIWKTINWLRGVKDCSSFCKKAGNSGGSCKNVKNYDTSTWCPKGQTCMCN